MKVKDLPSAPPIDKYREIVGKENIIKLEELADKLNGLKLQEINSARFGGGVAEMLSSYVPFVSMLGIDVRWSVMEAETPFFKVTKTLHNFLQGMGGLCPSMTDIYWETIRKNAGLIEDDSEVVIVHDPQPLGIMDIIAPEIRERLITLWRCHVHLEMLSAERISQIERVMREMVEKYNVGIFSTFEFLPIWNLPSFVIPPFIDPLSEKNMELPQSEIDETLEKYGINRDKPLITQVSRFDTFKDPIGVIEAFKIVRKKIPCQLLLTGGGASDDPEHLKVLENVRKAAGDDPDIRILDLPPNSPREINAFQRASQVIVQKSVKEGFGLTVTEGLWKGKPVVGGNVGGIPLQIRDGWNGFLVFTVRETASKISYLLRNQKKADEMGRNGREFVREHFLLPRGAKDHLTAIDQLINGKMVSNETIISYHPWH